MFEALHLPVGDKFPEEFPAIIEIPMGSRNKYEFEVELGIIKLDRVLHTTFVYPVNYGLVPQTWSEDGDPLDVMVWSRFPIHPYVMVWVRPVGVLKMKDEEGIDWKILAVPKKDPIFDNIKDVEDVPEALKKEIGHFFARYKELEKGKWSEVEGWEGRETAIKLLREAHERYLKVFKK